MKLGRSLLADRAAGEVKYYCGDNVGPCVVGKRLAKMFQSRTVRSILNRWTLTGLARNGSRFGEIRFGIRGSQKFETAEGSIDSKKNARSSTGKFGLQTDAHGRSRLLCCGWFVEAKEQGVNISHSGSLDGSSTYMVHRHDDVSFSILFNARKSKIPADPLPKSKDAKSPDQDPNKLKSHRR